MKIVVLSVLIVTSSIPIRAETIDIYVWAGQSNAGGGAWPPVPPVEVSYHEDVLYYPNLITDAQHDADSPIVLQSLYSFWPKYKGASWGSELSFAFAASRRSQNKIAIVKAAANSAGLETRWKSTIEGDLYDWLVTRVNVALADIANRGDTPSLAGIVWIQGETDAGWDYWAGNYGTNLSTLISDLRSDFNAPNLLFIIPELHRNTVNNAVNIVREHQRNVAEGDDRVLLINNDDQEILPDGLHYTNEMHIAVGRRVANAFFNSGDFNGDGNVDGRDLSVWSYSFGVNRNGDGNADGITDGCDYLVWQRQSSASAFSSIPEPSSFVASALLAAFLMRRDLRISRH